MTPKCTGQIHLKLSNHKRHAVLCEQGQYKVIWEVTKSNGPLTNHHLKLTELTARYQIILAESLSLMDHYQTILAESLSLMDH
jgi:hypothetical protein